MILILDCTRQDIPLLREEFVNPIRNIVQDAGYETTVHPLNTLTPPDGVQGVILSGTALMDHDYLKTGLPEWLLSWKGPVLGICAGMQLIAVSFGGTLIPGENIGMTAITVTRDDPIFYGKERFNAWELHQSMVTIPETIAIVAQSVSGIQGIRLSGRPWYGVLFHPEVRNEWVILNFLKFSTHYGDNRLFPYRE